MNCAAETSLGVITIRALNIKDIFFKNYLKLIDTDASLSFHSNAAVEWLILRVETLQNLIVLTAALLIVLLPSKNLPGNWNQCAFFILAHNKVRSIRRFCDILKGSWDCVFLMPYLWIVPKCLWLAAIATCQTILYLLKGSSNSCA